MRLPIFNLAWGFNNDKFGLNFTSELETESQDFSYFIPIPVPFHNGRPSFYEWDKKLFEHQYYFPFERNGEYVELKGKIQNGESVVPNDTLLRLEADIDESLLMSFNISSFPTVHFLVDIYILRSFYRTRGIRTQFLHQYIGNYKNPLFEQLIFVPVIPLNMNVMNRILAEEKGVFVGYIPEYDISAKERVVF